MRICEAPGEKEMNTALAVQPKNRALPRPAASKHETKTIRRIFSNDELIERFDSWLLICGMSPNTRTGYIHTARQFGKFLVDRPLTSVTKEDVRGFLACLYERNLAPATLACRHFALRTFFHFLQLGEQVVASPPQFIQTRKIPKRLPKPLSPDEIERLIAAAPEPRDRAVIEVFYATGVRISELAALCIEDVNLGGRVATATVRKGKGGKDRVVGIGRPAVRALREYLSGRMRGRVFPVSSRQIRRIVRDAATRAGLGRVHPHQLRHSFATHCLNHGMDIRYVQEILGHSNLMATQKYLHVAIANLQRTHAKFHPRG